MGPAPSGPAFRQADRGNPIQPVYPDDGSTLCAGPSAAMAAATHPNAARLFQDWSMGGEYARLSIANHNDPVRAGLTPAAGQKPLDTVRLPSLTVDEIAKARPRSSNNGATHSPSDRVSVLGTACPEMIGTPYGTMLVSAAFAAAGSGWQPSRRCFARQ